MRAWHFSENAYPYLPPAETYPSIRVTLPNKHYDPAKGAELYDRYIDEWLIAEDVGLDIMLNEHHQTATCVDPAAPLMLAILARASTKARLLILGNPISNRRQPVRIAEEMAMVDVISKGRLEAGFVRGVPYEILPANSNPVRMNERHWEALDLIVKAWTTHDGPFSWEGRFFHQRAVNIWPRPYQQPHPPIWIPSQGSNETIEWAAHPDRKYLYMQNFNPYAAAVKYLNYYREVAIERYDYEASSSQLGWAGPCYVAETDEQAMDEAREGLEFLFNKILRMPPGMFFPPGYTSIPSMRPPRRRLPSKPPTSLPRKFSISIRRSSRVCAR